MLREHADVTSNCHPLPEKGNPKNPRPRNLLHSVIALKILLSWAPHPIGREGKRLYVKVSGVGQKWRSADKRARKQVAPPSPLMPLPFSPILPSHPCLSSTVYGQFASEGRKELRTERKVSVSLPQTSDGGGENIGGCPFAQSAFSACLRQKCIQTEGSVAAATRTHTQRYRETHLLPNIGPMSLVELTLIWDIPPSCPAAQPVLPISHQPRQNQAEGGTAKIKVNPTQVRQEMGLPVERE